MDLLAQTRITVPAPVIEHHVPLWQVLPVVGVVLLAVVLIVSWLASIRQTRANLED